MHGNPETAEQGREIRTWLHNTGYEVNEITANELDDVGAMVRHCQRLAAYLARRDLRRRVRQDRSSRRTRLPRGPKGGLRSPPRAVLIE